MNREQLVRWCAVRERALEAIAEARRHIIYMNRIAADDLDSQAIVACALAALENAETHLGEAKTYAVRAAA